MATTFKVLGQLNPNSNTLSTLYTVPASTSAIISTISVANVGAAATFRIAIRPAGAAITQAQYLAYDTTLAANSTTALTLGITLAATDVVSVYASTTSVAFHAYGQENS